MSAWDKGHIHQLEILPETQRNLDPCLSESRLTHPTELLMVLELDELTLLFLRFYAKVHFQVFHCAKPQRI